MTPPDVPVARHVSAELLPVNSDLVLTAVTTTDQIAVAVVASTPAARCPA